MRSLADILRKYLAPDERRGTRAQRRHPYVEPRDPRRVPKGGARRRRWLAMKARSRRRTPRSLTQDALSRV